MMQVYDDPSSNFKLIPTSEAHTLNKRNMRIWDMLLNRLGLPDHLHEFVRGIYVSGNWSQGEWDAITLMRIARNLTSDTNDQIRVYYRLKKNCPKFFEWQEQQSFTIIAREILTEHAQKYKTKARYSFLLYDLVTQLLHLPKNIHLTLLKKAVNEALENYPKVDIPQRKPKKRRKRSVIKAVIKNINELIDLTGSPAIAAVELSEEIPPEGNIRDFVEALLKIKDL